MPLRTKRVYDEPDASDGARVLVDRLWPRGVKKDDAGLDLWLKEAAPSTALRQWFGHDPAKFAEFRRRYLAELAGRPGVLDPVVELLRAGRTVTLLSSTRNTTHNHMVVLAEHLSASEPAAPSRARPAARTESSGRGGKIGPVRANSGAGRGPRGGRTRRS